MTTEAILLGIIAALVAALIAVLLILVLRKPANIVSSSTDFVVLNEKLAQLEPVTQIAGNIQVALRGLSERISNVEQNQSAFEGNIQKLGLGVAEAGVANQSLARTAEAIRSELTRATEGLTELRSQAKNQQIVEQRTAESIRRLETIIAGTNTRGAAGENILEALFAKLPAEWQVRDFRVGDKFVEFGLRLPNDLILPIDSKWTATHLLERLSESDNLDEQRKLKSEIESVTLLRAREVRKYIDPSLTVSFGVAAVPDAVYDVCGNIQGQIIQQNVVMVSYSLFVPYLLLVFQTVLKSSQSLSLEKLEAYLQTTQDNIEAMQEELEGRFSRAITMLTNSRNDMSAHLSHVRGGLTSIRVGADVRDAEPN